MKKRHYKNGVISQLKIDDDKFVTSDKDILNAGESFFTNIYSSSFQSGDCNETQNIFFPKTNQNMLTPGDKEKCEGLLTKEEFTSSKRHEPQQNAKLGRAACRILQGVLEYGGPCVP